MTAHRKALGVVAVLVAAVVMLVGAGASAAPLDVGPLDLPAATVGAEYGARLSVDMGERTFRFTAPRRRLPRGLRLAKDGVLSGTPRRPGEFAFDVVARSVGRPRLRTTRTVRLVVTRDAGWTAVAVTGDVPPPRWGHAAALDGVRGRVVTFGGGSGVNWLADVDSLDLSSGRWASVSAGSGPTGRWGHSLIVDTIGDRALVFGGMSVAAFGDVWALDLAPGGGWTPVIPAGAGPRPSPRRSHSAAYDPALRRMLVFGGFDTDFRGDLWALDIADPSAPAWAPVAASGASPSPRAYAGAAFDAARGRFYVLGGADASGPLGDVHVLDLRAAGGPSWAEVTPAGPGPGPRSSALVTMDASGDRVLLFGGEGPGGLHGDLWALDADPGRSPSWTLVRDVSAAGPTIRTSAAGVFEPVTGRLLVNGGNDGQLRDDTWTIAPGPAPAAPRVAVVTASPAGPTARMNHTIVADPLRRRAVAFGGFDGSYRADAWSLDLADPATPVWNELVAAGPAPSPRFAHAAVLDRRRDRMLVVAGSDGTTGGFVYFDDVWALDLAGPAGEATWTELLPSGPGPAPRDEHVAVLDEAADRVIVFGGFDDFTLFDDVWALDLSVRGAEAWIRLAPAGVPPSGRAGAAAVYDPVARRMWIHGGGDGAAFLDDLWSLDLSTPGAERWERAVVPGAPAGRSLHVLVFDPTGPALFLAGGQALAPFADLHRLPLDGSGPRAWTSVGAASGTFGSFASAAADFEPASGTLVIHGGLGPARLSAVHVVRRR